MQLVVIESPYAGNVERNLAYARAAMADSLRRGEAPIASHLLYTQRGILNDRIPSEREQGIEAGLAWANHADLVAVYEDLGQSSGVVTAIARAKERGIPIEYRSLPQWAAIGEVQSAHADLLASFREAWRATEGTDYSSRLARQSLMAASPEFAKLMEQDGEL